MIPFQLGFRNLIGILLPGAVLAVVIFTCLDILFPGVGGAILGETGNSAGSLVVGFLLTAYILGSIIRLWSADTVDQLSASRVKVWLDPFAADTQGSVDSRLTKLLDCVAEIDTIDKTDDQYFAALLNCTLGYDGANGLKEASRPGSRKEQPLIRWAWKYDEFPYPVWEIMKLRLYHPDEVFLFFQPYLRCFATGNRRNKEFFNYCKTVIYDAYEGKRHALAEEVQSAEAYVRFFGGVFWALLLSALVLVLTALLLMVRVALRGTTGLCYWVSVCTLLAALVLGAVATGVVWRTPQFVRREDKVGRFWVLSEIAGGLLFISAVVGAFPPDLVTAARMNFVALVMLILAFLIIAGGRFRLSRLKEVDTVFDAFFLVQRRPRWP